MAVYSWGANSHGQLGLGFENELIPTPERLTQLPFNVNSVLAIKGGGGHVIVLDQCGQLFSCGWNNRGQLGVNCLDDKNHFNRIPSEYFDDSPVIKFACGWDISGAITASKKLYVWGSNSFQQLGICQRGFGSSPRPLRLILPRDEIPRKITFGLRHCAILTEDNKIYVFGRLKTESIETRTDLHVSRIPFNRTQILKIQMTTNVKIDSILSGQNHMLIILEARTRVIGVGDNKYGQSNEFRFNEDTIRVVSVGWTHNGLLMQSSKEILLWGRNTYGQIGCSGGGGAVGSGIGNNSSRDFFPTPNKLILPNNCVAEKLYLGSEHALALTTEGKIFTWGWNEHGNCGNGTTENLFSPTLIELPSACKIAGTGAGFCYALCSTDENQ